MAAVPSRIVSTPCLLLSGSHQVLPFRTVSLLGKYFCPHIFVAHLRQQKLTVTCAASGQGRSRMFFPFPLMGNMEPWRSEMPSWFIHLVKGKFRTQGFMSKLQSKAANIYYYFNLEVASLCVFLGEFLLSPVHLGNGGHMHYQDPAFCCCIKSRIALE